LYHRSSQLAAVIVAGIADPNFKARLLTLGVEANPFGQFIADEIAKWPKVIKLPTTTDLLLAISIETLTRSFPVNEQ